MKVAILDGHSKRCPSHPNNLRKNFEKHEKDDFRFFNGLDSFCEHNPAHEILFVNGNFFYLRFNECHFPKYQYDKYNFLREVIEDCVKIEKDSFKYFEVLKSQRLNEILRLNRLSGVAISKTFFEVNYTYSNSAGKEFCVTCERNFTQIFDTIEAITENRDEAVKWVNENILDSRLSSNLIKRINELYKLNKPDEVSNHEVNKSVVSFLKDIKSKIKNE